MENPIVCPKCGNPNEQQRTYCWVCYGELGGTTAEIKSSAPRTPIPNEEWKQEKGFFSGKLHFLFALSPVIFVGCLFGLSGFVRTISFPGILVVIVVLIFLGQTWGQNPNHRNSVLGKAILIIGSIIGALLLLVLLGFLTCAGVFLVGSMK